uniref:glucuronosyltransferase n=1 Tax=Ditylenchus dipsaci TaxID=166011 RepID=A0A915CL92_9BILA
MQFHCSYVTNLWAPSLNELCEPYAYNINQPIFQAAFGSDFPSLRDIVKNVSLLFINSNPFYDFPKPISNKVIYIGGIVESKNKPLTQEFQTIFQNTKSGVVLLSFGTFADSALMPDIIKKAFFQAFAHFSTYDFIWKLDVNANDTEALKNAPNVHAYKWTDQKAILAHPKTKAFITHCGANSMSESTLNGVPMLGFHY